MGQGEAGSEATSHGKCQGSGSLDLRHIFLVATYSFRFALRSGGGIVFLLIYLITGFLIAWIATEGYENSSPPVSGVVQEEQMTGRQMGKVAEQVVAQEAVRGLIRWWASADNKQVDYLLVEKPALVSAIFLMLLVFMPFITCLAAFNQTARDIGNRGFRYVLLRTERVNIFCGRFLASLIFCFITGIIYSVFVLAYLHFKLELYDPGELLAWGFQGFVALMVVSTAYIGLCSLISATVSHSLGSLALCVAVTLFSFTILKIVNGKFAFLNIFDLERLMPWGWKYELLHGDITTRLTAYAVTLGFAALFFSLGLRKFLRRDL